jgi:hypothetical protein
LGGRTARNAEPVDPAIRTTHSCQCISNAGWTQDAPLSESLQLDYGGRSRLSAHYGEEPMPHKFKVGDIVTIRPAISRFVPNGVFEVVKQLPGGSEPEYRMQERQRTA